MRKVALVAALAFLISFSNCSDPVAPDFDVHEWGVFLYYRGAGADLLSGIDETDLPSFVITVDKPHGKDCTCDKCKEVKFKCPKCGGIKGKCKCNDLTEPRKPVINFYTDGKLDVKLSVRFNDGKHTVWFPRHYSVSKQWDELKWEFKLTQKSENKLKEPKGSSWWEIARDTDSAFVNTKTESEKFLFYEGESSKLKASIEIKLADDKVQLVNKSKHSYNKLLVARDGKIVKLEEFPKGEIDFTNSIDVNSATSEIEKMLTNEGLNEKEVKGIAKIWKKEFFVRDGTRVIYMMTREEVDNILPLEITPKPKNLKRAMIACVQDTDSMVADLIERLGNDDPKVRDAATESLIRLGKPIKPLLEKALKSAKDQEVKSRIENILETIRKSDGKKTGWENWPRQEFKCRCIDPGHTIWPKNEINCEACGEKTIVPNVKVPLCSNCTGKIGICRHCGGSRNKVKK